MSNNKRIRRALSFWILMLLLCSSPAAQVDLSKYDSACGVTIRQENKQLKAEWQSLDGMLCTATFALESGIPLFQSLAAGGKVLATDVRPVFELTTGARAQRPGVKYIFFDKPATGKNGPVRQFTATLDMKSVQVKSEGQRATISFGGLSAGPFLGDLNIHIYAGSPFLQVEAAMGLSEKGIAYIYDAMLEGEFKTIVWKDLQDKFVRLAPTGPSKPVAVRNRTIMSENDNGTVAVFPPPHAFFFPRDYSINFKFAQVSEKRFGLRQDPAGGEGHQGQYTPWFDAPAGKVQRMSMFVYLSPRGAEETLKQIQRYTHGDTFKPVEGCITLASHMHSALTVHEHTSQPRAATFKKVFKGMNVQAFQLAEFHGDGHPGEPGAVRLNELKAMFELCRKYSDSQFVLLPSEEANAFFPGHTVLLFPKPVYLTLTPIKDAPFSEVIEPYGKVYHPKNAADLSRLLKQEDGLGWASHPRIKGSEGCPDVYKDTGWYKDPSWLGGTWKAMPADLSEPRLGIRSLDLLDDMNLWGQRKMILGEVDCFTIDDTHEIYGHMNVNYLRLAKLPGPDDWSPILNTLRRGDFFVTTGEVLLHSCQVEGGKLRVDVEWTLPLRQAELVLSDGKTVERKTLPLTDTKEFGRQTLEWPLPKAGLKWCRIEVWDIAYDGVFSQPIYSSPE